jgi:hypothetical protein
VSVFSAICEAMRGICTVQDKIVTAVLKSNCTDQIPATPRVHPEPVMISLGAVPKRHRGQLSASQPAASGGSGADTGTGTNAGADIRLGTNTGPLNTGTESGFITVNRAGKKTNTGTATKVTADTAEREDPAVRRFKDCIRDAECSSLVLNLNLGRIPIVNKETMSKRATLALTALAAKKENKKGTIPSGESVGALDDVLSVVKNISFFGSGTKTYNNAQRRT